eukprot:CAMPEP_0198733008 /NCGR_PEP_ID=MMETSP1475-20131203/41791_1 /TAXON_ID= ORGANISM="Unidentified sp., Strain CCMP1999" /NCGR_SAMPLE_ID=MMETSP1475 /ASSEMBLY_ACC=CAM_ASM_001111 /LENGTH=44 /DNA_ID= /DNA_START= /DNA_END= /DNA_ORIENTATION=
MSPAMYTFEAAKSSGLQSIPPCSLLRRMRLSNATLEEPSTHEGT